MAAVIAAASRQPVARPARREVADAVPHTAPSVPEDQERNRPAARPAEGVVAPALEGAQVPAQEVPEDAPCCTICSGFAEHAKPLVKPCRCTTLVHPHCWKVWTDRNLGPTPDAERGTDSEVAFRTRQLNAHQDHERTRTRCIACKIPIDEDLMRSATLAAHMDVEESTQMTSDHLIALSIDQREQDDTAASARAAAMADRQLARELRDPDVEMILIEEDVHQAPGPPAPLEPPSFGDAGARLESGDSRVPAVTRSSSQGGPARERWRFGNNAVARLDADAPPEPRAGAGDHELNNNDVEDDDQDDTNLFRGADLVDARAAPPGDEDDGAGRPPNSSRRDAGVSSARGPSTSFRAALTGAAAATHILGADSASTMLAASERGWRYAMLREITSNALSTVLNMACVVTVIAGTLLIIRSNLIKHAAETVAAVTTSRIEHRLLEGTEDAAAESNRPMTRPGGTDRTLPLPVFPALRHFQQSASSSGQFQERVEGGAAETVGTARNREDGGSDNERPTTAPRRAATARGDPITSTRINVCVAQQGHSFISHRDKHLFHIVPLTPQELTRSGLVNDPSADEIFVRVKIGYGWHWPVLAKGPYDCEPTRSGMVPMLLHGFQFPHVDIAPGRHGYTGRMPSGEEFKFQSPYDGVAVVPWPLQYVSSTGLYDEGHRCSRLADFRYDDTTPLSDQALSRLRDCGAERTDLEFLVLSNGEGGTHNRPLPWIQASILGLPSPIHLAQRIVGRLGRDFVGHVTQPTENIRSMCRNSGMPRSTVLVCRQGHDVPIPLLVGWDHVSREANVSVTSLRLMTDNANIRLLPGESDLHKNGNPGRCAEAVEMHWKGASAFC